MQDLGILILVKQELLVLISQSNDMHSLLGEGDIVLALSQQDATDSGLPQLEALVPVHGAASQG